MPVTEYYENVTPETGPTDILKIEGQPDIPTAYLSNCHYDYPDTNGFPRDMWDSRGGSRLGYSKLEVKYGYITQFVPSSEDTEPLLLGITVVTNKGLPSISKFGANMKCIVRALREPFVNDGCVLINSGDTWEWVSLKEINIEQKTSDSSPNPPKSPVGTRTVIAHSFTELAQASDLLDQTMRNLRDGEDL